MNYLQSVYDLLSEGEQEHLDTLCTLLRQPSISATGEGVRECAELLVQLMKHEGIEAKTMETDGLPVVFGEVKAKSPSAPTVLIYGHYDVQPVDPLDAWITPPFDPSIREGGIYARGSGDNKGQLIAHVLAVGALIRTGWPELNVKFLFDGEEEIGSVSLLSFIEKHRELLSADVAVSSDGPKHDSGKQIVFFGVRGILCVELAMKGARRDLHSGNKGGVVPQPAWELIHLLNDLYTPDGRCNIPGFYDDVLAPTPYEEELMDDMPFDRKGFLEVTGIDHANLDNTAFWRKNLFEPTFNICGLTSGYQGKDCKTIIPAEAIAKIDMRLVPNQDPAKILESMRDYLQKQAPKVQLSTHGHYPPSRTDAELPICQTVINAVREATRGEVIIQPRIGGSAPDYIITKHLKLPSIWVPFANPDENNHSPNENIGVKDFLEGIKTSATILYRIAENVKSK